MNDAVVRRRIAGFIDVLGKNGYIVLLTAL